MLKFGGALAFLMNLAKGKKCDDLVKRDDSEKNKLNTSPVEFDSQFLSSGKEAFLQLLNLNLSRQCESDPHHGHHLLGRKFLYLVDVWLHKLETDQSSDSCLYHEKDNMFSVDLEASESKKFVFVGSESKTTRFIFNLDVSKPEGGLMVLTPRLDGIDTSASHRGNHFFIKRRSDEFFNSEVLACPLNNISETTVLLPHRER
ncbi:Protease 2 [Vitis vinifera]|uniref:Protease 2 n=1 Tax=Vitis vinifera TaxID=29760 RepID=A0A438K5D7_VITVI|nr:Protease 2 [Vitis vinifera]